MDPRFLKSRFSQHFNNLAYLGMWSTETWPTPKTQRLYLCSKAVSVLILFISISVQMIDLYLVFGNLRKVTYNFCTSAIVIGIAVKIILMNEKKNHLNELRMNLWKDSLKLDSQDDMASHDLAYNQLKNIRNCFYLGLLVLHPTRIVSSYFSYKWGPRQLAFAAYLPMPDPLNDSFFVPALTFQAICGFYILSLVIEAELAMFSIVFQIEAYYKILIKNILKLNEIYGDENEVFSINTKTEVNEYLKKENAQKLMKQLIIRHLEILKYSKNFEYIFNNCMVVQVFAASLLVVMNGLEASMFLHEMSVKLFFQSVYVVLIVADVFLICSHLSKLSSKSFNLAEAAYSTVWYKMDVDMRRNLCMIIFRSQNPPRITAGKLFLMNLSTYLHVLRNIYSWLMLFRQLEVK